MKNTRVELSAHFLERLYERADENGLNARKFFYYLPSLVEAGSHHEDTCCMAIVGEAKLIFRVRTNDVGRQAIFVTVMPKRYRHDPTHMIDTVNLGSFA